MLCIPLLCVLQCIMYCLKIFLYQVVLLLQRFLNEPVIFICTCVQQFIYNLSISTHYCANKIDNISKHFRVCESTLLSQFDWTAPFSAIGPTTHQHSGWVSEQNYYIISNLQTTCTCDHTSCFSEILLLQKQLLLEFHRAHRCAC